MGVFKAKRSKDVMPVSERLWGDGSWFSDLVRLPLTFVSWIYGAIVRFRILMYQAGWLSQKKVDCRVVCVGNLTTGGTGKTPFTIYLAKKWQAKGSKVGIVSRGYRRKNKAPVVMVSDGFQPLGTPESVGDEAYLMAKRLQGVPIAVANDRYAGCVWLRSHFQVDVIILDDGFQHLKLHRDRNFLLIDASSPFGNGKLIPRGPLREPISEIRRADCVVLTRSDQCKDIGALSRLIKDSQRPFIKSRFAATELINLENSFKRSLSDLDGLAILAFCGLGNPRGFLSQLTQLGAKVQDVVYFSDHHSYSQSDILAIEKRAAEMGVRWILTTEKDAVKLKGLSTGRPDIWMLRVDVAFMEDPIM
ncbi:MAG: tetraacyldisaccharide 4'-kinase [Nitrospiria bacterium]